MLYTYAVMTLMLRNISIGSTKIIRGRSICLIFRIIPPSSMISRRILSARRIWKLSGSFRRGKSIKDCTISIRKDIRVKHWPMFRFLVREQPCGVPEGCRGKLNCPRQGDLGEMEYPTKSQRVELRAQRLVQSR